MLDKVCCIIDVDGFMVKEKNPFHGQSYRNKFLVRELGYVQVDPTTEYQPQSYHFDLRGEYDFENCSEEVKRTIRYQTLNVTGLSVLPGPKETNLLRLEELRDLVKSIYERCLRKEANYVAFKGGRLEFDLVKGYIPNLIDLQGYGCPPFKGLQQQSRYRNCGHHSQVRGNVIHCPLAEVTAYRDWFMKNVGRFMPRIRPDGLHSYGCCCSECQQNSD